jgi:hypothetical protein
MLEAPRQPRFKTQNTFETRREISALIAQQQPDKVPVILELDPQAVRNVLITRKKFLCDHRVPLHQFVTTARPVIRVDRNDALAVMVETGVAISLNDTLGALWDRHHDPDGFLYLWISADL